MFKFGLLELRQMHLGHTMEQDMTGMEWNRADDWSCGPDLRLLPATEQQLQQEDFVQNMQEIYVGCFVLVARTLFAL